MTTYEAIIVGDKLTWTGERPDTSVPTKVLVQLNTAATGTNGRELVKVIQQIIDETGGITSFGDPLEWQKRERVDRPLPGREP